MAGLVHLATLAYGHIYRSIGVRVPAASDRTRHARLYEVQPHLRFSHPERGY